MILIKRISDNEIMNDRQSCTWARLPQLENVQATIESFPKDGAARNLDDLEKLLAFLQDDKLAWEMRRKNAVVKMYGGHVNDYVCVDVPKAEERAAMTARYIEERGGTLNYIPGPEYVVNGATITVRRGWVRGNYRLIDDDVTDFSESDPLYFRLVFAQSVATFDVSVQLLTRTEDEDFGRLPDSLRFIRTVAEGRVTGDHRIILGGV